MSRERQTSDTTQRQEQTVQITPGEEELNRIQLENLRAAPETLEAVVI